MSDRQYIEDLVEDYLGGLLALAELLNGIFDLLVNGNIDAQIARLPPETKDWVTWELRDRYAPISGNDPGNYFIIEGVSIQPGHEDSYARDRARREERLRDVEVPRLQAWLRLHPLPPRECFPTDLVRGLHSRIEHDFRSLLDSRPTDLTRKQIRAWPANATIEKLGSIGAKLDEAVRRAELAGTGSQEQALAWEGFDRVAPLLAEREDLSGAERELICAAEARRRARLALMGRSAPGTRGVFSGGTND